MSPYGTSKLVGEWLSRDVAVATGMRVVALRYFNVAGAASPELGDPAVLNLIPMVFRELVNGGPPRLFGNDYPTPDGTCVRDFIHVADIADAHVAALQHLDAAAGGADFKVYNVSRGVGASNLDVINLIGDVTGYDVTPNVLPRRPGDPARIVGSVKRLQADYGWTAKYDLRDMVASAWEAWQHRANAG
jgi:UDP-glucose 4-epimerase